MLVCFASCDLGDERIIIKQLSGDNIDVKWYYYSLITDNAPGYIAVEKDGKSKIIYEADEVITNVFPDKKNITIRVVHPDSLLVYTKEVIGYTTEA